MARIFTIQYSFDGETYNSMVSVKTTPFYMEYTLGDIDSSLATLLPGNKIIAPSAKNFFFPNAMPHHSKELMQGITKAVAEHLQTVSF